MIYGDSSAGITFLVMNANSNIGYDPGINAESGYLNTNGGAEFQVFNGTIPIVQPDDFPSNVT